MERPGGVALIHRCHGQSAAVFECNTKGQVSNPDETVGVTQGLTQSRPKWKVESVWKCMAIDDAKSNIFDRSWPDQDARWRRSDHYLSQNG